MMTRRMLFTLAFAAPLIAGPQAVAAEGDELDLEALFNTSRVGVATKREQSVLEAPAVVEVVTREELLERGYASVAEALRAMPGFYVVEDQLLPSVGVRGLSSGQRAWSRIVKVMIDGQPVPYRPDGANWLGPELIPIELVRRIEVIRGPASALYGADAFLGVVNVVTVRGSDVDGAMLATGGGVRATHYRGRAGLALGGVTEAAGLEGVLGGAGALVDQSGLAVAPTSPLGAGLAAVASRQDVAMPASGYGRLAWRPLPAVDVSIDGAYQRLRAGGEFQDWKPLTHQSVIAAENRFVRAQARRAFGEALAVTGSAAYSRGNPTPEDRISLGRQDYLIERQLAADGFDFASDATWTPDDRTVVTVGGDFSRQVQALPTYFNVFTEASGRAGERQQAGSTGGTVLLDNWGGYVQGTYYPLERLGITANLRDDQHSVYGNNLSSRLGLVYRLADDMAVKGLFGSSFKAPSVPQLYGTPLIFGDILGNRELKPERATTIEGALTYAPSPGVSATGSVYWTHVEDKVSFFTRNGNPFAVNLGQLDSAGVEAGLKWRWRFLHGVINSSLQKTVPTLESGFADPEGVAEPYPGWMLNAGLGAPLGFIPVNTWVESRYVGWVPSSQANFAANGHEPYALPPAFVTDLTFTNAHLFPFGGKGTHVSFKVHNLFDAQYAQPGFGGVDYPGLGRTFVLRLGQAF